MAGYLFSLGKKNRDSLINCISSGSYSTIIKEPENGWKGTWNPAQEGTFADYCSMSAGDNVYFFMDRKIYGIGILVDINGTCRFLNYPNSNYPIEQDSPIPSNNLLVDFGERSINNRFICSFKPHPHFFQDGIDMDEVLSSAPEKFKILRAFWKLSFIKFSDSENQAFKDIILRRNLEAIANPTPETIFNTEYQAVHETILNKTKDNSKYDLNLAPFLNTINNADGSLKHEMAIEASLIYQLSMQLESVVDIFGKWDYLTHQVIASPLKPIDYMDKMDVFGYKYIEGQKPTISDFLVVEIKKDQITSQDVLQLMKYVDWIKNEYAYGDYSMIKAFMLGFDYAQDVFDTLSENVERRFIKGVRPSVSTEWNDVRLIQYKFNDKTNLLDFADVTPN